MGRGEPWRNKLRLLPDQSLQMTFPVAQTVKHLPTMQETQVRSLGQEDPLEKAMASHSSTLACKSRGWRILVGYSSWGCMSDFTSLLLRSIHFSLHSYTTQLLQQVREQNKPNKQLLETITIHVSVERFLSLGSCSYSLSDFSPP